MPSTAGYSGTPLGRKLGLKDGMRIRLVSEPQHYWTLFGPEVDPEALTVLSPRSRAEAEFTHLFATSLDALRKGLARARKGMTTDGMIWVSWPKQSSSLESAIGRAEVMAEGKAAGLVDVKVCAVDEDWSGLKFVIPVKDRG